MLNIEFRNERETTRELTIDSHISPSDPFLRQALFDVHKGICFYSKESISFEAMHVEHIHPRAKGGTDTIANYYLASSRMNLMKLANYDEISNQVLVAINRHTYAPRVLKKYLELSRNAGAAPKKLFKKEKKELIREAQGGDYDVIRLESLKIFLRNFSEKYPENVTIIPNEKIIIHYDSRYDHDDIDIAIREGWYSSQLCSKKSDNYAKWSKKDKNDAIGYYRTHTFFYRKRPVIERSTTEIILIIEDLSGLTLDYKMWADEDVTELDIEKAEIEAKKHNQRVRELLAEIPV